MAQSLSWDFQSNPLWGTIFSKSKNLYTDPFSSEFVKFVAEWYSDQQQSYTTNATILQTTVAEKLLDILIDQQRVVRKVTFYDFKLNIVLNRPWKEEYKQLFEGVIIETCNKVEFVKA